MRRLTIILGAALTSCRGAGQEESPTWLGDACGVPGLEFTISRKRKQLSLKEYQVQGTERTETGQITGAAVSDRQRLIERALPCLKREAGRRGLTLEYPVVNVDG